MYNNTSYISKLNSTRPIQCSVGTSVIAKHPLRPLRLHRTLCTLCGYIQEALKSPVSTAFFAVPLRSLRFPKTPLKT